MVAKTLSADRIQPTGDGLDYDAADETWTIDPGVIVYSPDASGVFSNGHANNTLINDGKIYAAASFQYAVRFDSGNASVFNAAGAEILGGQYGVFLGGPSPGNVLVNNFGDIIALIYTGIYFSTNNTESLLNNHGYVFGGHYGVADYSNLAGGTINNFHTIRSNQDAIYVSTPATLTTHITNAAGGVINGLIEAILVDSGMLHVVNHGTVVGNILDNTSVHQVIINPGKIHGTVELGSGNDVFNGTGGTSGAIFAGGGNDRITGGKGNVVIHVGTGNDTLTAGPGHDQFIFDSALASQVERITNFNLSLDKIVLSEADFAGIGAIGVPLAAADFHIGVHATTASQRIIYNAKTGFLYYDGDGSGPNPQVHFATIGAHLTLTHNDFVVAA